MTVTGWFTDWVIVIGGAGGDTTCGGELLVLLFMQQTVSTSPTASTSNPVIKYNHIFDSKPWI